MDPLEPFAAATQSWFRASFAAPTEVQRLGWPAIRAGGHTLIHAPTGSGKTLAAFLWSVDHLMHHPPPDPAHRCRVLYVSPLKALAHDIDRNLRTPLLGIRRTAERLGEAEPAELTTFLRTGDTTAEDRRRMLRNPPDILITTPESLYLLLTSRAREVLRSVRWVIVDEVHAVAGVKRGAHLALSLERLEEVTETPPQRIGLSATQRPPETIARFLAGGVPSASGWDPRPVTVVDATAELPLDVELVVPVDDMAEPPTIEDPEGRRTRSIWPSVYPRILELIESHGSTIVFANSRRLAERLSAELNALAGKEIARAHHGSVAREHRLEIEEALKGGRLAAVVATSSLELGIDMGSVDLVIQVEAPLSVASGLQRVGRSGHQVGAVSKAKVFPKHRGDLLLATVVVDLMVAGRIEETRIPRNPLDVLAQQLVAATVEEERTADGLFAMVRRAAPFAELTRRAFDATLDMLTGHFPSDLFADLRPRLAWDRISGIVSPLPGARQLAVTNPGAIPDRGLYRVTLPDGTRVGELDEEMVYESRPGDVFVLGASTWRIAEIGVDRVEVVPAPAAPSPRLPFWHGDALGRSVETGKAVGRFVEEIAALPPGAAQRRLRERYRLDERAARNLVSYLHDERAATGALPTDRTLVAERFRDELGDWRLVLLSPLGARIHAPWAMALTRRLRAATGTEVDGIWSDDGIALRFPDSDHVPSAADFALDPEEVETTLTEGLADTALFGARFREAAGRALLLPRRRPGRRTPLWLQRRRAADLLGVAKGFASFPILLETYREVLQDDFDVSSLVDVLTDIRARRIRLVDVETDAPSPFASSLLFAFVAAYLYEGDAPLAERRAAALTLDRELLRELLGEAELRELISPELAADLEEELQHLTPERAVRGPDGIHGLLRDLGPLGEAEITRRAANTSVAAALEELARSHRAVRVRIGDEAAWAAIEDTARLRDALGVPPPPGVPAAFLEPVPDPLGDLVGRVTRTRGPVTARQVASLTGLPPAVTSTTLQRLEAEGRLTRGSFRPGGGDPQWVDVNVLRRLKRRSLAALRRQIEPVDQEALGRFLPAWQHAGGEPRRGLGALRDVVRSLQGAAIPASVLERDLLPSRHQDPAGLLDRLLLTGEMVWVGRGPLGQRDGRLALYFRDEVEALHLAPTGAPPEGGRHDAIRHHLASRGASFFADLYAACGGGDPDELLDALWDLVWAGEVTNDTLAPVRAFLTRRGARSSRRPTVPAFPAHGAGRWYSVATLHPGVSDPTRSAVAWAGQLLERHGIVTRPTVLAEGIPGGFAALYPALSRLEETGRIRRGYFVEGLGGSQFALPGAVDRLRAIPHDGVVALAAADPANPWGATLPWPARLGAVRSPRAAGSYVILADGAPTAHLDGHGRLRTDTRAPELLPALASAIASVASRHRRFLVNEIDGKRPDDTTLGKSLRRAGFAPTHRGLAYRRRPEASAR